MRDTEAERQWARVAGRYERGLSGYLLRPLYEKILELTSPRSGESLLDVGAGAGPLVVRAMARGVRAVGIDSSPAMTGVANERAPGRFLLAQAERLPFPDASFDVVTTSLSLHHWEDPARGFAEVARVLRPGGRALFADVEGKGVVQRLANAIRRHGGNYFTRETIAGPLRAAGLTPVRQGVLKKRWVLTLAERP